MGQPSLSITCMAAVLALWPIGSRADDDIALLRSALADLKAEHAERVAALEARIERLESLAGPQAAAAVVQSQPAGRPPAANTFNPAISVILTGAYAELSQDPESYRIAGFMPGAGEQGPGQRGFSLGESELTLSANVDPYFTASLTVAIGAEDDIGVEEAYIRSLALPAGLSLKAGRFFSGVGYLNEVHAHAWDFVDQPLSYQALLGGQLAQEGVQLKWLAPTDLFLELAVELGSGDSFPATRRNRNGANGGALFAHLGGDIGDDVSWRSGLSWLDARAEDRLYMDDDGSGQPVTNAFTGISQTWIADATFKWKRPSDPRRREFKLQGEYLRRTERGSLAYDIEGQGASGDYSSRQSGWYLQAVYQFLPRWRAGLRYDALDSGTRRIGLVNDGSLTAADFPVLLPVSTDRVTAMFDFSPSEFSRLRAQYAWDDARNDRRDRQLMIQYIHAIGAHGAHKF